MNTLMLIFNGWIQLNNDDATSKYQFQIKTNVS